jgi:hypothetical protein
VRCRAEVYERSESHEERDTARVRLTYTEDNEDSVDAATFTNPSVRATVKRLVDDATFASESVAATSTDLVSLEDAALALQDAIAAPGEFVQDVDQQASTVIRLADSVERQFEVTGQFGRDQFTNPESHSAVRQLRILSDRASRATAEKASTRPRIITRRFLVDVSIFDVAVSLSQEPMQLIALNPQIPDQNHIPAGTPVRVFESAG